MWQIQFAKLIQPLEASGLSVPTRGCARLIPVLSLTLFIVDIFALFSVSATAKDITRPEFVEEGIYHFTKSSEHQKYQSMEIAQSFTARRSAASNLPTFQLPPPDLSALHKYPVYAPAAATQSTPAVVSTVLTPPSVANYDLSRLASIGEGGNSSGSAAGVPLSQPPKGFWPTPDSSVASGTNSLSSQSSVAGIPPYQPTRGFWPTPQNSYTFSSAPPMPAPFAQQQQPQQNYMGRPLYSPSMNVPNRRTNSPTAGKGLSSPLYDLNLLPPPTSISMSGLSGGQHQNLPTLAPQQQLRPQYSGYNLPAMNGPIMSNVHTAGNQMALFGGMNMQYPPLYGHLPGQQQQQSDRPFKCDQCPQSFNRNHDLKRHKRIHLAVKPFPCGHCEKGFSRKDALKVCCRDIHKGRATLST